MREQKEREAQQRAREAHEREMQLKHTQERALKQEMLERQARIAAQEAETALREEQLKAYREEQLKKQFQEIQQRLEQETEPQEIKHILIELRNLDYKPATQYAVNWMANWVRKNDNNLPPLERLQFVQVFLKDSRGNYEPKLISLVPKLLKDLDSAWRDKKDWRPMRC